MIKGRIAEIACIAVTGAARAAVMVGWRRMASRTIGAANRGMIKGRIAEIVCIAVAGAASAAVVVGGRNGKMNNRCRQWWND